MRYPGRQEKEVAVGCLIVMLSVMALSTLSFFFVFLFLILFW